MIMMKQYQFCWWNDTVLQSQLKGEKSHQCTSISSHCQFWSISTSPCDQRRSGKSGNSWCWESGLIQIISRLLNQFSQLQHRHFEYLFHDAGHCIYPQLLSNCCWHQQSFLGHTLPQLTPGHIGLCHVKAVCSHAFGVKFVFPYRACTKPPCGSCRGMMVHYLILHKVALNEESPF